MERVGLYPGAFAPLALGRADIISRALKLYDKLIIGVAANDAKRPLFLLEERVAKAESESRKFSGPGIAENEVRTFTGLLKHFLMADVRHQAVASRLVKEIANLGGDISAFVSPDVQQELLEKYS